MVSLTRRTSAAHRRRRRVMKRRRGRGSKHFDLLAPFYDRLMCRSEAVPLAEALNLPSDGVLLDVGGGTGRVSHALAPWVREVVVCDASRQMLERARQGGVAIVQGTAEHLPFGDGAIERVLVVDALHHFRSQEQAVRELVRVLAPKGRLLVSEPDTASASVRLIAFAERLALMDSRFLSPEEIAAIITAQGLATRIVRHGTTAWIIADRQEG